MKQRLPIVAALVLVVATVSEAGVIDWPDVSGLRTFKGRSTGRVWLNIDNFFDLTATYGTTPNNMIAAVVIPVATQ
jgi:hypothetical protein